MAELINTTARVIGFLGGKRRGGITLPPGNERVTTSAELDGRLHDDRTLRAYLESGAVIDALRTFGDAPALTPAPALARPSRPANAQGKRAPMGEATIPPPVASRPASLADVGLGDARSMVAAETDLSVLRGWFNAETRTDVREWINARGVELTATR